MRWKTPILAAALLVAWIAEDLYVPRHHDLRSFDPARVATLRALFAELTQLLRQE